MTGIYHEHLETLDMTLSHWAPHGYGAEALKQVIAYVRQRPGARELLTCVGSGEGSPGPFYEKLGFAYTGVIVQGERAMRRSSEALRRH